MIKHIYYSLYTIPLVAIYSVVLSEAYFWLTVLVACCISYCCSVTLDTLDLSDLCKFLGCLLLAALIVGLAIPCSEELHSLQCIPACWSFFLL